MSRRDHGGRLEEPLAAHGMATGGTRATVAQREPVKLARWRPGNPQPDDVAGELDGEPRLRFGPGAHLAILARMRIEARSTRSTITSITISSVPTWAHWKSSIELKSRKPIPPAPNALSTSAARTFESIR